MTAFWVFQTHKSCTFSLADVFDKIFVLLSLHLFLLQAHPLLSPFICLPLTLAIHALASSVTHYTELQSDIHADGFKDTASG